MTFPKTTISRDPLTLKVESSQIDSMESFSNSIRINKMICQIYDMMSKIRKQFHSPCTKEIVDLGRDHSHYPPPWVSSQCWTLLGTSSFLISLLLTLLKSSLSSYPSGCFCLVFFAVSSYLNTIEIFHVCSVFQQQISPVLFHFLS